MVIQLWFAETDRCHRDFFDLFASKNGNHVVAQPDEHVALSSLVHGLATAASPGIGLLEFVDQIFDPHVASVARRR